MQKRSVVDQVMESIIQDIIEGRLSPGDRLPTETELSRRMGAGRNSVREAIKKLEAYGVCYIRRADGTFVNEHYSQKMLDPILYSIILQKNSWNDFVEMRRVIDTGTLHVVVGRQGLPANLQDLRAALTALEKAVRSPLPKADVIMDCDTHFHNLITEATGNPQLASISDYVTRLTIPSRARTLQKILRQGDLDNFISLHRQLLEIIETKRADLIDPAVNDHYMYWK